MRFSMAPSGSQPQLLSSLLLPQLQKLLLATSYPTSSPDTQKEGTAWHQAGLRSRNQRPCVKVFVYMSPNPPRPPGVASEGYSLQLLLGGIQLSHFPVALLVPHNALVAGVLGTF